MKNVILNNKQTTKKCHTCIWRALSKSDSHPLKPSVSNLYTGFGFLLKTHWLDPLEMFIKWWHVFAFQTFHEIFESYSDGVRWPFGQELTWKLLLCQGSVSQWRDSPFLSLSELCLFMMPSSFVCIFSICQWFVLCNKATYLKNSKWVWSGNTTITNCRQPRGIARKSRSTITRHQEDKLSKATSSLFPIKMIAILEWT